MSRLIYETRRSGLDVWLATDARQMIVEVRRAGTLLAKAEASHWGILGPDARGPEKSPFAAHLIDGAIAKAFGRPQRSSFDLLVDELAQDMATRHGQRIVLFKGKAAPKRSGLFSAPVSRRSASARRK